MGITPLRRPLRIAGPCGDLSVGGPGDPLLLIAGPCVLEERDRVLRIAEGVAAAAAAAGVPCVFKASFDKANRSRLDAPRGPGLDAGLELLAEVRQRLQVPVTTDVHWPEQAAPVAEVVDILQVPAFLCRQTDLLVACARTGRPVNVKKGQFLAPRAMGLVVDKLRASGAQGILATERGSCFGYDSLVVDLQALPQLRALGVPACIDATHSVQRPGALDGSTGGDRAMIPFIARGAVAAGVDAVFMEVHDDPERARSDAANQLPLALLPPLLEELVALDAVVKQR
ncbi:MAG: 3-deoxy-8-phosphooctulonate synthase [Deltaproteobacteria bacterium]|nr:MAG: 3-deoxy-8-phosphooctulonate synthase [Deltaproteobacteria bacterium]